MVVVVQRFRGKIELLGERMIMVILFLRRVEKWRDCVCTRGVIKVKSTRG